MNLTEPIKSLQRDVQSYKTDNEILKKSKEQPDNFNIMMLQSLEIIEKKLDKETSTN
jgi:hypothetical protein